MPSGAFGRWACASHWFQSGTFYGTPCLQKEGALVAFTLRRECEYADMEIVQLRVLDQARRLPAMTQC